MVVLVETAAMSVTDAVAARLPREPRLLLRCRLWRAVLQVVLGVMRWGAVSREVIVLTTEVIVAAPPFAAVRIFDATIMSDVEIVATSGSLNSDPARRGAMSIRQIRG